MRQLGLEENSVISAVNLSKKYGNVLAVDNITLNVDKGEVFGFLGPNGAGKTTTINMLIGMLMPTTGKVYIDGIDVVKDPVKAKSHIGYVPDKPNIYEKLTALEIVMFVAKVYGIDENKAYERAMDLFRKFEIHDRINDLVGSYSHGMKQKVVITSALIHDPDVIFLDEPTVGLDPKSARLIKDILKDLAREGKTVFITTHILDIAEKMCDRVGIIKKGKLLAVGSLDELRSLTRDTDASLEDLFLELTEKDDNLTENDQSEV